MLDLGAPVRAYLEAPGPEVTLMLQSHSLLLQGMMATDGITVLRSDG